jgi:2-C-methyl-D-erythritol 4-phosphate cytidylyltransferase
MMRVTAIIVAAGEGKRFGSAKQFATLKGKSVLDRAIEAFENHPEVHEIILVLPDENEGPEYQSRYRKVAAVVRGGRRRQDSVRHGFERVHAEEGAIALVHDGVRPLVSPDVISRVIREARRSGAAVPVVPVEDTIKEVTEGKIVRTVPRERLCRVQTPQGFAYPVLETIVRWAHGEGQEATDEAGLAEKIGVEVRVVEGDPRNIKVTAPADLKLAEAFLDD